MELAIIIILIVALVIYLYAQDSNKETTKEKYGDAVGKLAHATANTIGDIAQNLTESDDNRKKRVAREKLADKNGRIFDIGKWLGTGSYEHYFEVDDSFRDALKTMGLAEDIWKKMAKDLFYLGIIHYLSKTGIGQKENTTKSYREHMFSTWPTDPFFKDNISLLKEALDNFNIPYSEWIDYGDVVVQMHSLLDNPIIEKYGFIN